MRSVILKDRLDVVLGNLKKNRKENIITLRSIDYSHYSSTSLKWMVVIP